MNPHSKFPSGFSSSRQLPTPIGSGEKLGENLGVPQPLECLHGIQIPPFLSKTYELVDDTGLDPIISWGSSGQSFVVWDPVEFSRIILPRSFKHNNFSSFVRQLNTYGFRKIDTDRWEFANENFLQGKRQLLKNIQRRRSPQSQHDGSSGRSSAEEVNISVEGEIERLRIEKGLMMQEVFELQQQQRGTIQHMEAVNEKLQAAEHKQKQMVSFLAKVFQNPEFLDRIRGRKEQRNIVSPRTVRKFIKQHLGEQIAPSLALDVNIFPTLDVTARSVPSEAEDIASHELPLDQDSCLQTEDPLFKGKTALSLQPRTTPEYFGEDLVKERNISELFSPGIESMVKQEDGWNLGFESSGMMSQYGNEIWDNLSNKKLSEFGVPDELSDVWSLGSPQVGGASGTENRPIDEYTFDELESLAGGFEDNSYRKMDP